MALKTCTECNKEHSDTITTCPHCGFVTPIIQETHPLIITLRTFGATISIFIILSIFHNLPVGISVTVMLLLSVFICPYFYHKKEHHIGYKVASYLIWGITTMFWIFAFAEKIFFRS